MRHSIFSAILFGILLGAMLFFMPHLVVGIFLIFVFIRLLQVAFMGHGYYRHGYHWHGFGRGCDCGYRYGRGYEPDCDCGCGPQYDREHDFHQEHHYGHHYGHGPMHEHMFYWVDKVRNMSDEEFAEFKNKMDKGFGSGRRSRHADSYKKDNHGEKGNAESGSESADKKEDTSK